MIGNFEDFHTYLSHSGRSIYTEINFRVQKAFRTSDSDLHVTSGDLIDLGLPGGTITTADGTTVSFGLAPNQWGMTPGGTYLVSLAFNPSGQDFYTLSGWDLSGGKARPVTECGVMKAQAGKSILTGMSTGDITNLLNRAYLR